MIAVDFEEGALLKKHAADELQCAPQLNAVRLIYEPEQSAKCFLHGACVGLHN
jgi:hypothetical protein